MSRYGIWCCSGIMGRVWEHIQLNFFLINSILFLFLIINPLRIFAGTTLWGKYNYPHFAIREAKSYIILIICPRSNFWVNGKVGVQTLLHLPPVVKGFESHYQGAMPVQQLVHEESVIFMPLYGIISEDVFEYCLWRQFMKFKK